MRILIALIIFSFSSTAFAGWYVVNAENKVVAKCDQKPDEKDLQSRKEAAIFSGEDISFLEAECRGGKVYRHVKTSAEIEAENKRKEEQAENDLIEQKLKAMAIEQLKSEGVALKS